jgi:hypothetical protein
MKKILYDDLDPETGYERASQWWLRKNHTDRRDFLVVSGQVGTGKSTLVKRLAGCRLRVWPFAEACERHAAANPLQFWPQPCSTLVLDDVRDLKLQYGFPWWQALEGLALKADTPGNRLVITTNLDADGSPDCELAGLVGERTWDRLQKRGTFLRLSDPVRGTDRDWGGVVPAQPGPEIPSGGTARYRSTGWLGRVTGSAWLPRECAWEVQVLTHRPAGRPPALVEVAAHWDVREVEFLPGLRYTENFNPDLWEAMGMEQRRAVWEHWTRCAGGGTALRSWGQAQLAAHAAVAGTGFGP